MKLKITKCTVWNFTLYCAQCCHLAGKHNTCLIYKQASNFFLKNRMAFRCGQTTSRARLFEL